MQPSVLENIFKGKVVILGVGNALRGDDGLGPALIKRLKGKVKALCFDAGSTPENYAGRLIKEKPDNILIVDALHLGLAPGEYEILEKEGIKKNGFSTHDMSLNMFIEYLENQIEANIYILGVQPENLSLGEPLSDSINRALEELSELIKKADRA